eukprot:scaffold152_cov383-Prasinococcus_capsulatus_cf.AAC.7
MAADRQRRSERGSDHSQSKARDARATTCAFVTRRSAAAARLAIVAGSVAGALSPSQQPLPADESRLARDGGEAAGGELRGGAHQDGDLVRPLAGDVEDDAVVRMVGLRRQHRRPQARRLSGRCRLQLPLLRGARAADILCSAR